MMRISHLYRGLILFGGNSLKEIGLYLHIPFCKGKCYYCDFLSIVGDIDYINMYVKSLGDEISLYKDELSDYKIVTIYFGGGTPSILSIEQIDFIMNKIYANFSIGDNIEISMEANPGTLTREKISYLKKANINRLSIGLQSSNDRLLNKIGRIHSLKDFHEQYHLCRELGFKNINIDLIYGLPDQSLTDWENTLKYVLSIEPEHISPYSLKIEEGTEFYNLYKENKLNLPDDEMDRKMYHLVAELLEGNGYKHYEISNFCKPGYECKHNLIYWHNNEYLGLGASSHSYIKKTRFSNTSDIEIYIKKISENLLPIEFKERNTPKDEMFETIILGLRLMEGINIEGFKDRFGVSIFDLYGDKISKLKELGLLDIVDGFLRLTPFGIDVSNQVFVEFMLD